MSEIVVQAFVTLDGVAQAPGGEDEDREDGFVHGGWQQNFRADEGGDDSDLIPEWESRLGALLLGRKTYERWSNAWGVWPEDAPGFMGEFTRRYNRVTKYVASHTLTPADLGWKNSQLLGPDLPAEVAALREQVEGEIRVWGSLELIHSLAAHDLVDEYRLIVYPIVLGSGKKLFSDGFATTTLSLVSSRALASGAVVSIYRRAT